MADRTPGYLDPDLGADAVDTNDERLIAFQDLRVKKLKAGEDWAVSVSALGGDDTNNGKPLGVFKFDQTIEEGVGFDLPVMVPSNATKILFMFTSRAEVAPAGVRTVGLKLYSKEYPDNAAVGAWSAGIQLNDIDIPANEFWQYDEDERTLASLGVNPGSLYRFEWTRVAPLAGTNLAADWTILESSGISLRFI